MCRAEAAARDEGEEATARGEGGPEPEASATAARRCAAADSQGQPLRPSLLDHSVPLYRLTLAASSSLAWPLVP